MGVRETRGSTKSARGAFSREKCCLSLKPRSRQTSTVASLNFEDKACVIDMLREKKDTEEIKRDSVKQGLCFQSLN